MSEVVLERVQYFSELFEFSVEHFIVRDSHLLQWSNFKFICDFNIYIFLNNAFVLNLPNNIDK